MKTLEQLGISPYPWNHTPADEYTHAGIDDANGDGVGEEVKRATKIVSVLTVLFAPFALVVFPFFIGWMICDSFIKAISVPLAKWCEESEVKE